MKIAFACDHGGYPRKEPILNHLKEKGYEVLDFGTDSEDSCHYPAFALPASEAIRDHKADKATMMRFPILLWNTIMPTSSPLAQNSGQKKKFFEESIFS